MAKVYSWQIQETPRVYAYIADPQNTNEVYIGNELFGQYLQTVVKWAESCTDKEYIEHFNALVAKCAQYNVKFESVEAYMGLKATCDNLRGPAGRGIRNLESGGKNNGEAIYYLRYDDGTYDTFTVLDGADGAKGADGARGDAGVSSSLIMLFGSGKGYKNEETEEYNIPKPSGVTYNFINKVLTIPKGSIWKETDAVEPPIFSTNVLVYSTDGENGVVNIRQEQWSQPIQMSGEDGKPGEDGDSTEFIYKLTKNKPEKPVSENIADKVPSGWTDRAQGVDEDNQTEWMCMRKFTKKRDEKGNVIGGKEWGEWTEPAIWSKFGVNGQDGDGIQYIYLKNKGYAPANPTPLNFKTMDSYQDSKSEWMPPVNTPYEALYPIEDEKHPNYHNETNIKFVPDKDSDDNIIDSWTDDPSDVNIDYKFSWVSSRKYKMIEQPMDKIYVVKEVEDLYNLDSSVLNLSTLYYISTIGSYYILKNVGANNLPKNWSSVSIKNASNTKIVMVLPENEVTESYTDDDGNTDTIKYLAVVSLKDGVKYGYLTDENSVDVKYYKWTVKEDKGSYTEINGKPNDAKIDYRTIGEKYWTSFSNPSLWAKFGEDGSNGKNGRPRVIRKMYKLTSGTSEVPDTPANSVFISDWAYSMPKDYQYGVNTVWCTDAELWADTYEFVSKYDLVLTERDENNQAIKPSDSNESNTISVDEIPEEKYHDDAVLYLYFAEEYFKWNEGGWCTPYLLTGTKGEDFAPVNYSSYMYCYGLTELPPSEDKHKPQIEQTISDKFEFQMVSKNGVTYDLSWVDYIDTSDNKIDGVIDDSGNERRWYVCSLQVDRYQTITKCGEVSPCNPRDGEVGPNGNKYEFRFAVVENADKPIGWYNTDRIPILTNSLGVTVGWFTSEETIEPMPPGGSVWQIVAEINGKTNELVNKWSDAIRVSGEKGEQGPPGPTGLRGVSGIPGASFKNKFCLGTYGSGTTGECYWGAEKNSELGITNHDKFYDTTNPINLCGYTYYEFNDKSIKFSDGYFGELVSTDEVILNGTKMIGWFDNTEIPNSDIKRITLRYDIVQDKWVDDDNALDKFIIYENIGRVFRVQYNNTAAQTSEYQFFIIEKGKDDNTIINALTQKLTKDESDDFNIYIWCTQGVESYLQGKFGDYKIVSEISHEGNTKTVVSIPSNKVTDEKIVYLKYYDTYHKWNDETQTYYRVYNLDIADSNNTKILGDDEELPISPIQDKKYLFYKNDYYKWVYIDGDSVKHKLEGIKYGSPFKIQGTNGLKGLTGNRGQVVYPMGTYNPEEVYECTEEKAPYVFDPSDSMFYVYENTTRKWVGKIPEGKEGTLTPPVDYTGNYIAVSDNPSDAILPIHDLKNYKYALYYDNSDGQNKFYEWENNQYVLKSKKKYDDGFNNTIADQNGDTPSMNYANGIETGTNSWTRFESFEALYTSVGIIANGMVGSAVFNNEFMFSQQGINQDGYETNFAIESSTGTTHGFLSAYGYNEKGKIIESLAELRYWYYKEDPDKYLDHTLVNPYECYKYVRVKGEEKDVYYEIQGKSVIETDYNDKIMSRYNTLELTDSTSEKDFVDLKTKLANGGKAYIHTFMPNVCINFRTGQMWLQAGKLTFGQSYGNVYTTDEVYPREYFNDWASDGYLSPMELSILNRDVQKIVKEYYGIVKEALLLGNYSDYNMISDKEITSVELSEDNNTITVTATASTKTVEVVFNISNDTLLKDYVVYYTKVIKMTDDYYLNDKTEKVNDCVKVIDDSDDENYYGNYEEYYKAKDLLLNSFNYKLQESIDSANYLITSATTALGETIKSVKSELTSQADKKAQMHYQSEDPSKDWQNTNSNETSTYVENRIGDLWFDTDDESSYIFTEMPENKKIGTNDKTSENTGLTASYYWKESYVPKTVYDTIDGKANVFVTEPTTPYYVGDLWFASGGTKGNFITGASITNTGYIEFSGDTILVCLVNNTGNKFNANHWGKRDSYADEAAVETARQDLAKMQKNLANWAQDGIIIPSERNELLRELQEIKDEYPSITAQTNELDTFTGVTASLTKYNTAYDNVVSGLTYLTDYNNWTSGANTGSFISIAGDSIGATEYKKIAPYYVYRQELLKAISDALNTKIKDVNIALTEKISADTKTITDYINAEVSEINKALDGKIDTYVQENDPSSDWEEDDAILKQHIGDLWYKGYKSYTFVDKSYEGETKEVMNSEHEGYIWVIQSNVPQAIYDSIDGKNSVFVTQPTPPYHIGDLWILEKDYKNAPFITGVSIGTDGNITPSTGTTTLSAKTLTTCLVENTGTKFSTAHWGRRDNFVDEATHQQLVDESKAIKENLKSWAADGKLTPEELKQMANYFKQKDNISKIHTELIKDATSAGAEGNLSLFKDLFSGVKNKHPGLSTSIEVFNPDNINTDDYGNLILVINGEQTKPGEDAEFSYYDYYNNIINYFDERNNVTRYISEALDTKIKNGLSDALNDLKEIETTINGITADGYVSYEEKVSLLNEWKELLLDHEKTLTELKRHNLTSHVNTLTNSAKKAARSFYYHIGTDENYNSYWEKPNPYIEPKINKEQKDIEVILGTDNVRGMGHINEYYSDRVKAETAISDAIAKSISEFTTLEYLQNCLGPYSATTEFDGIVLSKLLAVESENNNVRGFLNGHKDIVYNSSDTGQTFNGKQIIMALGIDDTPGNKAIYYEQVGMYHDGSSWKNVSANTGDFYVNVNDLNDNTIDSIFKGGYLRVLDNTEKTDTKKKFQVIGYNTNDCYKISATFREYLYTNTGMTVNDINKQTDALFMDTVPSYFHEEMKIEPFKYYRTIINDEDVYYVWDKDYNGKWVRIGTDELTDVSSLNRYFYLHPFSSTSPTNKNTARVSKDGKLFKYILCLTSDNNGNVTDPKFYEWTEQTKTETITGYFTSQHNIETVYDVNGNVYKDYCEWKLVTSDTVTAYLPVDSNNKTFSQMLISDGIGPKRLCQKIDSVDRYAIYNIEQYKKPLYLAPNSSNKIEEDKISTAPTVILSDGTVITDKLVTDLGYFGGEINSTGYFNGKADIDGESTFNGVYVQSNTVKTDHIDLDGIDILNKTIDLDQSTEYRALKTITGLNVTNKNGTNSGKTYTWEGELVTNFTPSDGYTSIIIPPINLCLSINNSGYANVTAPEKIYMNLKYYDSYNGANINVPLLEKYKPSPTSGSSGKNGSPRYNYNTNKYILTADSITNITISYSVKFHLNTYSGWLGQNRSSASLTITPTEKITCEVSKPISKFEIGKNGINFIQAAGGKIKVKFQVSENGIWLQYGDDEANILVIDSKGIRSNKSITTDVNLGS